jgi:predicted metal-dependent hydrolase
LFTQLSIVSPNEHGFSLQQGIIRMGPQIWVGDNSALKTRLMNAFHSTVLGGHLGIQATYYRIKKLFQWKGLNVDVETFVKQCAVCQHAKHERTHLAALLQPLPISDGAWQDITMDFVEDYPSMKDITVFW